MDRVDVSMKHCYLERKFFYIFEKEETLKINRNPTFIGKIFFYGICYHQTS